MLQGAPIPFPDATGPPGGCARAPRASRQVACCRRVAYGGGGGEARLLSGVVDPRGRHPRPLLATAVFPMPDTVRSVSTPRGVVAAAVHEQKLELAKRLL